MDADESVLHCVGGGVTIFEDDVRDSIRHIFVAANNLRECVIVTGTS